MFDFTISTVRAKTCRCLMSYLITRYAGQKARKITIRFVSG